MSIRYRIRNMPPDRIREKFSKQPEDRSSSLQLRLYQNRDKLSGEIN